MIEITVFAPVISLKCFHVQRHRIGGQYWLKAGKKYGICVVSFLPYTFCKCRVRINRLGLLCSKRKVLLLHAVKICWGRRSVAPLIRNLTNGWRWVVNFTLRPFYPWEIISVPIV
jgi:hypothetical protein